jgi:hypothetical protein
VRFYAGDEVHHLKAGSGILIDSELPHRAERLGDAEAHMLMVVTRSGAEQLTPEWWNIARQTNQASPEVQTPKANSALSAGISTRRAARRSRA